MAVRSEIYQRVEELAVSIESMMEGLDLLPSVEGWHPKDVFGNLVIELGEWTLAWPISFLLVLAIFKLNGWLLELKYESVTDRAVAKDSVNVTTQMVE